MDCIAARSHRRPETCPPLLPASIGPFIWISSAPKPASALRPLLQSEQLLVSTGVFSEPSSGSTREVFLFLIHAHTTQQALQECGFKSSPVEMELNAWLDDGRGKELGR